VDDEVQEDFYYVEPMVDGGLAHVLKFQDHEVILMHRRRFYRAYNETPVKGPFGMNPKLAKFIAKQGFSIVGAVLIGYIIKTEKKIEAKIDEHYAPPVEDTPEED
jgi:hypothetical protein